MNDWLQIDKVCFMQGLVVNNNNKVALKPWNVWVYEFAAYEPDLEQIVKFAE